MHYSSFSNVGDALLTHLLLSESCRSRRRASDASHSGWHSPLVGNASLASRAVMHHLLSTSCWPRHAAVMHSNFDSLHPLFFMKLILILSYRKDSEPRRDSNAQGNMSESAMHHCGTPKVASYLLHCISYRNSKKPWTILKRNGRS